MVDTSTGESSKKELILRDYLAADRTLLAVDRTFLSYIRTALTLFVAGVSFIKFFDSWLIQAIGWLLIPCGVITFVVGLRRCLKMGTLLGNLVGDGRKRKRVGFSIFPSYLSIGTAVRRLIITLSQRLSLRMSLVRKKPLSTS